MEDVQNHKANVAMPIDSVGVRNLRLPIRLSRREGGAGNTVALVELGVELPARFKGTHMSRFVEALEMWNEDLNYASMKKLLQDVLCRLQARKAQIIFSFPYFLRKPSPVSSASVLQGYDCRLTGGLSAESDGQTTG